MRALLVIVSVLAGTASAEVETLPLSRTGAASQPCPANRTCGEDAAQSVAGIRLVVHHQDSETDRIHSLRVGAVDVGLGMYGLEAGPGRVSLTEGTLDDRSAGVAVVIAVGHDGLVTACGLGSPACTRQVRVTCPDEGCRVRLAGGVLRIVGADGKRTYRVTRSYLSN